DFPTVVPRSDTPPAVVLTCLPMVMADVSAALKCLPSVVILPPVVLNVLTDSLADRLRRIICPLVDWTCLPAVSALTSAAEKCLPRVVRLPPVVRNVLLDSRNDRFKVPSRPSAVLKVRLVLEATFSVWERLLLNPAVFFPAFEKVRPVSA